MNLHIGYESVEPYPLSRTDVADEKARTAGHRFVDYKERVVDLIRRVTTVSFETQKIVEAMKTAVR